MTPLTRQPLEEALDTLPPALRQAGVDGDCDAFALALREHLISQGTPAELMVIARTRQDQDTGEVIDDNPLSHVVVGALGTEWDVLGSDACARWENDWIQPFDEGAEDSFDFDTVTEDALIKLRQARDQRAPNPAKVDVYRQWLSDVFQAVAQPEPRSSQRTRRPF